MCRFDQLRRCGWGPKSCGIGVDKHTVSAWHRVGLHCREAPLLGGLPRPPENCGMCCLVMTLPWVHDSQPQPGSVWVDSILWVGCTYFLFLVSKVELAKKLEAGNMFHFKNLCLIAITGPTQNQQNPLLTVLINAWLFSCLLYTCFFFLVVV